MIFHSSFEYIYLLLPLIGFTVGFFASVLGSGGGFFFLPVLILIFNVPAHIAVATSLAASLPICIVGSLGHYRKRNIHMQLGLIFAVAGIIGAVAGAGISSLVTSRQLKVGFGIYSIMIAFQLLYNTRREKIARSKGLQLMPPVGDARLRNGSLYGFAAGIVTGTFGTSGAAPVLAGLFSMRIPLKVVAGTSLMIITVTTISALGAHFLVGTIDLTLVYFLTSGAVIGSAAGPEMLAEIKTDRAELPVRNWYAFGLAAFGLLMILSN
jgi:uncharacterized protein